MIGGDLITWPATLLTGSAVYQLLTVQLYADFEQRARLAITYKAAAVHCRNSDR